MWRHPLHIVCRVPTPNVVKDGSAICRAIEYREPEEVGRKLLALLGKEIERDFGDGVSGTLVATAAVLEAVVRALAVYVEPESIVEGLRLGVEDARAALEDLRRPVTGIVSGGFSRTRSLAKGQLQFSSATPSARSVPKEMFAQRLPIPSKIVWRLFRAPATKRGICRRLLLPTRGACASSLTLRWCCLLTGCWTTLGRLHQR
ncbi:TCP-1/cpn60 chaperonin family protein [Xanthobacter sp. AM33]|uniref:TCP-1/cpn60 chaperonin family protein n=1 Tax=Xanthobacter sp. AM33 TaxID=3380644 RepID=UPI0039BF7C31